MIITTGVVVGLLAVGLFARFTKSFGEIDVQSSANDYVIDFGELNSKLYIKAKSWGIAGNHEEIVLSSSPFGDSEKCAKDKCFVFYTSEIYYKKEGTDTLLIYVGASAISGIPTNFPSSIKIIQMELKNYDEVKDYEMNYKKYGLSRVTVYQDK